MRSLLFLFAVVFAAAIISNGMSRDADVRMAIYQEEAQTKRDAEQAAILARLERKQDAKVSEFVQDWRRAYPTTDAGTLQELQLIEQEINSDIAKAGAFTLAAQQANADRINDAITTPFGGKFVAKPGL